MGLASTLIGRGFLARWAEIIESACAQKVQAADMEITGSSNGLILESPDGTRWRITIDNAGALTSTSL